MLTYERQFYHMMGIFHNICCFISHTCKITKEKLEKKESKLYIPFNFSISVREGVGEGVADDWGGLAGNGGGVFILAGLWIGFK